MTADALVQLERHNFRQIEALNQRGGRTLSIVDLIQAGTLDVQMAAVAMQAIEQGASLLTGAVPGGAGKTTLLAALLGFLPPGVPIYTVDHPGVIHQAARRPAGEPVCYLVHEIGSGPYYGYLWGPAVADYLGLIAGGRRIASCLHADTLDQLRRILTAPPLGVPPRTIDRVGLILFMAMSPAGRGYRRRVAAFYHSDGTNGHRLLFRWMPAGDRFVPGWEPGADAVSGEGTGGSPREGDPPQEGTLKPVSPDSPSAEQAGKSVRFGTPPREYIQFIERLTASGEVDYRAVRRRVLEFYARKR